ncbi:MAG: hypothetical protein B7Z37_29845 [Verrucomicrobia bacterium 12-59-8]|nr:MAG: hypothetical protein B7Z37_29845 [Verrucomicrobia bacterium 12-59-8]
MLPLRQRQTLTPRTTPPRKTTLTIAPGTDPASPPKTCPRRIALRTHTSPPLPPGKTPRAAPASSLLHKTSATPHPTSSQTPPPRKLCLKAVPPCPMADSLKDACLPAFEIRAQASSKASPTSLSRTTLSIAPIPTRRMSKISAKASSRKWPTPGLHGRRNQPPKHALPTPRPRHPKHSRKAALP